MIKRRSLRFPSTYKERTVFLARDTPVEFLLQLNAIARGDFAVAGLTGREKDQWFESLQSGPRMRRKKPTL
jgi:hypothetical protein